MSVALKPTLRLVVVNIQGNNTIWEQRSMATPYSYAPAWLWRLVL